MTEHDVRKTLESGECIYWSAHSFSGTSAVYGACEFGCCDWDFAGIDEFIQFFKDDLGEMCSDDL